MSLFKKKKNQRIEQLVELMFSLRKHGDIAGSLSYVFPEDCEYLCSLRDKLYSLTQNLFAHLESKGVTFSAPVSQLYNNLGTTSRK